jgi:cullin-4
VSASAHAGYISSSDSASPVPSSKKKIINQEDSKKSLGSITKGVRNSKDSKNESLNTKKAKITSKNTDSNKEKEEATTSIFRLKNSVKKSMDTDGSTSSKSVDSNAPLNRIMRNTSLNLTSSSSSGQASKRLVIKNLKETPKSNGDFFTKLWKSLESAVTAIHKSMPVSMSLEILYQYVENLCAEKKSSTLYSSLKQLCEEHIKSEVAKLNAPMNDQFEYLKLLNRHWQEHCSQMMMICQIFLPLDRGYVLNNPLILSIWDLSLDLFKNHIISNKIVQVRCVNGLLMLIERERSGELIDRSLVKNLLNMLYKLQLYQSIFECEFIKASEKLYAVEGVAELQLLEVPEYLRHVEKRYLEENNRLLHYLHPSSRIPLINSLEKYLIGEHIPAILQKGFDIMMDKTEGANDLKLLYQLLNKIPTGVDQLKMSFCQYIKKRGREIVINPEKDNVMIQELLDFKEKLDTTMDCWNSNEKFLHALKDSFEHFINQRPNKPAELTAKYIDNKLKSGNKEATEEELDKILDKIMVLFRFIHGKDVFEAFYKKDLAKRLLAGKSASDDAEKSMLSKLKQECGGVFTLKLEGMFKDMELSKDIMVAYEQQAKSDKESIGLNVYVLTLTHWPSYSATNVLLPPEIASLQEKFSEFYKRKYSGRNLQWQPALGNSVIKANISPGVTKEFQLSIYQSLVLLVFDNKDEMTYEEILESTKIDEVELKKTLQSLACGKITILSKTPKSLDINNTDVFRFLKDFTHKHIRIKFSHIQFKETPEENNSTNERVFQDRQYQVDAAIVRVMKMRKTLLHNLLITEIVSLLKFPIKPPDIKKRIESLIDRDYLARDEQNPNQYNYLA